MYNLVEVNKGKYFSHNYDTKENALKAFEEMDKNIVKANLPYELYVMHYETGHVIIRNKNSKDSVGL